VEAGRRRRAGAGLTSRASDAVRDVAVSDPTSAGDPLRTAAARAEESDWGWL